ncbi:OmpA family protein [Rhodovastum atsumiense]|uniref:OmpA family protein n=1 Tax=Rhodovastum atsumiense TaxID=504468 RepID=UPI00139F2D19|nr:OmpA family protein [Rhodovastum atsumiense]
MAATLPLALLATGQARAQQPVPTASDIARACGSDVDRLCPGVPPGGGRIKQCMKEHVSQLSAPCFDTLMSAITVMYTLNSDMLFPPGGWQLSDAGKEAIAQIARKLAPTQEHRLYVSGFTDSIPIGPELAAEGITSNLALSQRRADAVMQFLISQGVNPALVVAKGFGDADPIASNATPEGRARNRRVELSLNPL